MKIATLVAFLALLTSAGAAADQLTDPIEIGWTIGFNEGPGYLEKALQTGLGFNAGTDTFRLRGSVAWTGVHKDGTPGGYSIGGGPGIEVDVWKLHAFGGFNLHFTDQKIWTKRVHYAYAGMGYRWSNRPGDIGMKKAREVVNLEFTYSVETFSTYANHVRGIQGAVHYDYCPSSGPLCIRTNIAIGGMWFRANPYPNACHMQGATISVGVGLGWRPLR